MKQEAYTARMEGKTVTYGFSLIQIQRSEEFAPPLAALTFCKRLSLKDHTKSTLAVPKKERAHSLSVPRPDLSPTDHTHLTQDNGAK